MMDNKFWMNVWAVIVAMLLMSWVVRPVLSGVLGVKEGKRTMNTTPPPRLANFSASLEGEPFA